jgi:hypothetical protein
VALSILTGCRRLVTSHGMHIRSHLSEETLGIRDARRQARRVHAPKFDLSILPSANSKCHHTVTSAVDGITRRGGSGHVVRIAIAVRNVTVRTAQVVWKTKCLCLNFEEGSALTTSKSRRRPIREDKGETR